MIRRLIGIGTAVIFMFLVAVSVYYLLDYVGGPVMKPVSGVVTGTDNKVDGERVGTYTIVKKVKKYSYCGDSELYSRGQAEKELVGLDLNRLRMMYPVADGWDVTFDQGEVTITKTIEGLCGLHREYRHLGIHEGRLAVYQGPLGIDEVLLRVEKGIALNQLPDDWRSRLEKAARFDMLDAEEKLELQETIEFQDEYALNMVLENFDEMDDQGENL